MMRLRSITCFGYGFRQTNSDVIQFIRFNLLVFAIIFFFSYVSALAAIRFTYSRTLQETIVLFLSLPIVTYAAAGTMYYYISYSKGITVRLNQLYRGYRYFLHYLLYAFILDCIYIVFWKNVPELFGAFQDSMLPLAAGSVFFMYAVLRLFFLPIVLVDTRLPFEESLIESLRLSRTNMTGILLFVAVSVLLLCAGLLIAGAGILYSSAVILLSYIKYYLDCRDELYAD
ncbi:MAG: hypothetical protein ACOC2H_05820 [Spirochaetota bacterium]